MNYFTLTSAIQFTVYTGEQLAFGCLEILTQRRELKKTESVFVGYTHDHDCMYVNGTGQEIYEFYIQLNRCNISSLMTTKQHILFG
jgi:hypothetical protein